jgi:hypothetical protein
MPIRRYANARPLGRDNSDYTVSDYSANTYSAKHSDYCDYTEDYSNINNTVSDYSVSADSVLLSTLAKMSPAYKAGKAASIADPLGHRLSKILRKLRPKMSNDRYIEIVTSLSAMEPLDQAQFCHIIEERFNEDNQA